MSREAIAARSLAKTHPDLAREWHPDNDRTPDEVTAGSGYRAQWVCLTTVQWPDGRWRPCGHTWATKVAMRGTAGTGCPACTGKAAADWNSLAATHPHLAADWNDPRDITTMPNGSAYRAQWRCATCGHEWTKSVEKRSQSGYGCPGCSRKVTTPANNLTVTHPDLTLDWHPENPTGPAQHVAGSNTRVMWRCRAQVTLHGEAGVCGHEWMAAPKSRTGVGSGCPACYGMAAAWWNSLAAVYPLVAAEWSALRNSSRADAVPHGRKANAWWACATCSHEWHASIQNRTRHRRGCPACSGNVVTDRNRLSLLRPDLVAEWHPDNERTPEDVSVASDYRPLWLCSNSVEGIDGSRVLCGHVWRTRVANRTLLNNDCPACRMAHRSKDELHLAYEIAALFPDTHLDTTVPRAQGAGRPWTVDIAIPSLRLIVEYDGRYYHDGKTARDQAKTDELTTQGWTVLRVREEGLPPVREHNVTVTPAQHKGTADLTLRYMRDVLAAPLSGLDDYLAQPSLRNGDAARAEIRRRLEAQMSNRERRAARNDAAPAA